MKTLIVLLLATTCAAQTAHYAKQDTKLTPGVIDNTLVADLSKQPHMIDGVEHNICAPDFVTPPFRVATKNKKIKTEVCKAYGVNTGCPGPNWELDDLVPIEVGGKNVQKNLWNQPIKEARVKDHQLEDVLGGPRGLVCKGKITLKRAQECIVFDWRECVQKIKPLR